MVITQSNKNSQINKQKIAKRTGTDYAINKCEYV